MTISGETGEFLLANAPPGEVTVRFDHAEFATASRRIRLSAGDSAHDLGEIRLPRGARIRGIVVDEKGEPQPGVTVFASADGAGPIPRQPADGEGGRNWGQASTGEDGRFVIHGLRSGRFRLQTWSTERVSDQPTVETDGPETRIVSQRADELTAYVRSRGVPVANAWVSALLVTTRPDGSVRSEYVDSARTDGTGFFRLARLPPSRPVRLTIRHDGYRNGDFDQVSAADKGRVFELESGQRVAGTVVDGEGAPVARCVIRVTVDGSPSTWVTSDAEGAFLVGGLESGEIRLTVTESDQNLIEGESVVATPGARSVRLVAERGLSIEGRILDRDGRPVRGVWTQAFDEEGNTAFGSATMSEEGVFAIRGLRAGTYTLRVLRSREGEEPAVLAVRAGVEAGAKDVTIEVAPG